MNKSTKIGLAAALVLGLITAAINPRAGISEGKLYAVSCSTKHMFIPANTFNGFSVRAGVYTPESLVGKMMPQMMAQYAKQTAGNPFQGIGLLTIPAMKEPLIMLLDQAIDDGCEGDDLSYLKDISLMEQQ